MEKLQREEKWNMRKFLLIDFIQCGENFCVDPLIPTFDIFFFANVHSKYFSQWKSDKNCLRVCVFV